MLLSDAILKGTRETKRANCIWYDENTKGFCALGAAAYAVGAVDCTEPTREKNTKLQNAIYKNWKAELNTFLARNDLAKVDQTSFNRSFDAYRAVSLQSLIFYANDILNWRRDRIGRFVKRLGF